MSKKDINEVDNIEQGENETESIKQELVDQKESFLRLVAEYDNYRKRTQRDMAGIYNDAVSDAVTEFLPLADSLDGALNSTVDLDESYQKGLELLRTQFLASLQKLNVEPFGEVGETFDPELHNAVAYIKNEDDGDSVIVEVFRKGYRIRDKVIRHAMVKVAN